MEFVWCQDWSNVGRSLPVLNGEAPCEGERSEAMRSSITGKRPPPPIGFKMSVGAWGKVTGEDDIRLGNRAIEDVGFELCNTHVHCCPATCLAAADAGAPVASSSP